MMNSLWIAKTGMSAQQTQMDVVSHNLSNVSTTGYKRQSAVFEDLIYQNLRQVGSQADEQNTLPTGMHLGLGVRSVATTRNFTQGTPLESGKAYDVAINGDGFFQIQMPDGTTAYTRDGTFSPECRWHSWSPPAATRCWTALPCRQIRTKLHHQQDGHRHRAGPGRGPARSKSAS